MGAEEEKKSTKEIPEDHRIHKTHFGVVKPLLRETDYDTGYEWVEISPGHSKRVPRKEEKAAPEKTE